MLFLGFFGFFQLSLPEKEKPLCEISHSGFCVRMFLFKIDGSTGFYQIDKGHAGV